MFPAFADVPAYPLVFPLFWGAAIFFALAMARHLRVFAAAQPSAPFANLPARFVGLVEYAFIQTKMFKDPRAGLMHAGIFWGFVLLTVGTADSVTGGVIQTVLSAPQDGVIWAAISAMQNVVAVEATIAEVLKGRGYVTPQDVKSIGMDVLRHRVAITYEAEAEEKTSETVIQKIFDELPVP